MRLSGTKLCTFHWSHTFCLWLPIMVYWGSSSTANGIGLEMPGTGGNISCPDTGFDVRSTCIQWLVLYEDSAATRSKQQLGTAVNSVNCVTALLLGLSGDWNVIKKSVLSLGHTRFSVYSEKILLWWHTAACIHLCLWLGSKLSISLQHQQAGRRGHWQVGPFVPLPAPCPAAASSLIQMHTSAQVEDQPWPRDCSQVGVLRDRTQNLWDWGWRWYFMGHLAKLLVSLHRSAFILCLQGSCNFYWQHSRAQL